MNAEIATADARRKTYYDAAATWAGDVNGRLKATARIAWMVAAGACAVAVLMVYVFRSPEHPAQAGDERTVVPVVASEVHLQRPTP